MKPFAAQAARLAIVFALLVGGIESLKLLVAWWQAGRPTPGVEELLAFAALALVAVVWWRHSVFACRNNACLAPEKEVSENRPPR